MNKNILYRNLLYLVLVSFSSLSSNALKAQNTVDFKIHEVYGELNGDFFKGNNELYNAFVKLLKERVQITEELFNQNEKYVKISSLALLNKYNSLVVHNNFKSVSEFNPLKYQMDFFANTVKVYRIDNTDLIIVIDPQ